MTTDLTHWPRTPRRGEHQAVCGAKAEIGQSIMIAHVSYRVTCDLCAAWLSRRPWLKRSSEMLQLVEA